MEQPLRRTKSTATRSGENDNERYDEGDGVAWYGGTERPLKSFSGSGKRFFILFLIAHGFQS